MKPPPATATAAVQEFMQAVADSNLTRMAELFGNSDGPAAKTHKPVGFEKRMIYIQAVLHGVQARTLSVVPAAKVKGETVTTQLTSNGCKVIIPVTAVKADKGWIVHDFDLEAAGKVNQPCDAGRSSGNR